MRRELLALALGLGLAGTAGAQAGTMTVHKDPNCGCCGAWVDHMTDAGFRVEVRNTRDLVGVKRELGVPRALASCHTAVIDGHLIEGHVPAADVRRFLAEARSGEGLAVPGMPIGSPGMEVPGRGVDDYQVMRFRAGEAGAEVYSRHP